jgi:hypothetical protein
MGASYEGSMAFPASGAAVFQACMQAVPQSGFKLKGSDEASGQIYARKGLSLMSWGESITITVTADGRVTIKSSSLPFQLVAYGRNQGNVNKLFAAIGPLVQAQPPAAPQQ